MPGIQTDRIGRCNVRDAAAEIEPELQPAVHQVQTDEVAFGVVELAVVEQEAVACVGEEPELDRERFRDALQAGQLQESVARHLGNQQLRQLSVHCRNGSLTLFRISWPRC